jgi:hypothetical protein
VASSSSSSSSSVRAFKSSRLKNPAKRVELSRPEREPMVGVEVERRIFAQIRRQYESPAPDLIAPLSSCTRHTRHRHAAGVDVPWHQPVRLPKLARKLNGDVPALLRLLAAMRGAGLAVLILLAEGPAFSYGLGREKRAATTKHWRSRG